MALRSSSAYPAIFLYNVNAPCLKFLEHRKNAHSKMSIIDLATDITDDLAYNTPSCPLLEHVDLFTEYLLSSDYFMYFVEQYGYVELDPGGKAFIDTAKLVAVHIMTKYWTVLTSRSRAKHLEQLRRRRNRSGHGIAEG